MSEKSEVEELHVGVDEDLREEEEKILNNLYKEVCLIKIFLYYLSIYY